ncbi:anhydro-N-acetylmuramic acid kinase [Agromyces terreus]|uniref:Anhydro-N-acetylmuramic acid kinase n=1 Tax=Agromyces terreus TaxID=424795 RepID=A0A9X2KC83_9MICO|nr:anhydro-N-acetylmuramic acid kinase [Agromyces terreus]MCP2370960.1 anhydro-N-acetylmuramic acid kinase [Agromyces terreus]
MIVLSLQSGTSADGIDVAVVDITVAGAPSTAGDPAAPADLVMRPLHAATHDFDAGLRERVLAVSAGEATTAGELTRLTTRLGQAFAEAAARGIRDSGATPDLVVSHGQTVFHWAEHGHALGTLQLGEPAWIAELTGVPVLSDLRAADIAAGGEGAPLMAFFDRAWLGGEATAAGRVIATVNLGGIANVQLVHPSGDVLAFDSGPGNALVDAVVARHTSGAEAFDRDGAIAAAGTVSAPLLDALLRHPYLAATPPKSTGRETFDLGVVDAAVAASGLAASGALAVEDLVATLVEFTARTVVDAIPDAASVLVCSGGGARNPVLLERLRALAAERGIRVASSAERGIDPAFKESLMFALLGFFSLHAVPVALSTVAARVAGRVTPGREPFAPPAPLAGVASVTIASPDARTETGGAP